MLALKDSLPLKIFYFVALAVFVALVLPFVRFYFTYMGFRWLYIFLFSFSLSYLLTPLMRVVALKTDIIDDPDQRKIHTSATPLLGGIAILIAFSLSLAANMLLEREMLILLTGGMIMALLGLLDDVRGIPALAKLLVQVLVVVFLVYHGIILDLFPPRTTWGFWMNLLFTLIWMVGITNAMNFIDGMDGLASGLSAIMAAFIGIVAFQTDQPFMGWIAIAIVGSCLGFLPFNFRPAKPALIFLGDAGSTFLGFMLAGLAVMGYWSESRIVSFANPVLIFWVLIFDMIYITVERVLSGKVRTVKEWIDYVGTDHLHHRLFHLLGDKRKAVLTIFLLSATLGLSSIALRNARMIDGILLVGQAFLITIIFSIIEYSGRRR
ncbi:MAG: undecaprenyl/decaprenyl-phosphate alpha-N-acetylglucosaminyl 1-phosphate transferase [Deltaproteobacteria bacterium]|nr:undecaprenyl/decaprenyl-phosphate alpha-N-acetylglucosaminyl 1-phosphate transferase [Deltaproteobacteria bacterium]